jgi:hypothetical protein
MTREFSPSLPSPDYPIDCHGAVIRAYARSVATVLTVRGDVDALNSDSVYRHLGRFNRLETALILDITEAKVADLGALCRFVADDCDEPGGVAKAIVARPEVRAALRNRVDGEPVPVFGTVADAVQLFVRNLQARRDPRSLRLLRPA